MVHSIWTESRPVRTPERRCGTRWDRAEPGASTVSGGTASTMAAGHLALHVPGNGGVRTNIESHMAKSMATMASTTMPSADVEQRSDVSYVCHILHPAPGSNRRYQEWPYGGAEHELSTNHKRLHAWKTSSCMTIRACYHERREQAEHGLPDRRRAPAARSSRSIVAFHASRPRPRVPLRARRNQ